MPKYSQPGRQVSSSSSTASGYTDKYKTEVEALLTGASSTVEAFYSAQADGDGYHESAQSDTPTAGFTIQRKLWYATEAQLDPDAAGWVEYTSQPAPDTSFADAKTSLLNGLTVTPTGEVPLSLKMTWEEVSAAGKILDEYSGAVLAFSVSRKLRDAYAGAAFRVRRASDNNEQDIGFDASGDLDETALLSFCAGTDGYVKCLYDQSGGGHNYQQTSIGATPKIVNGGALITDNGKPAMQYDGGDSLVYNGTIQASTSNYSVFFVANRSDVNGYLFDTQSGRLIFDDPGTGFWYDAGYKGAGLTYAGQTLASLVLVNGSGAAWNNGVQVGSGLAYVARAISNQSALGSAYTGGASRVTGTIQEFIVYNSDQSANQADIETNINNHFSVF